MKSAESGERNIEKLDTLSAGPFGSATVAKNIVGLFVGKAGINTRAKSF